MVRLVLFVVTLALLAPATSASAADWILTLGVRGRVSPTFEGANFHVFQPLPIINVRRADKPFRYTPPSVGATFDLIDLGPVVIGPVVRIRHERTDQGKYAGLQPIPKALLPGGFVEVWPKPWLRARVEARRSFTADAAWSGDLGLDLIHTGARWDASIGPRLGYGDANYMRGYFGVSPAQAARGPLYRTPYAIDAGLRYSGVTAAASYHLTRHWRTAVDVSYQRLASAARSSPIVRTAGAGDQISLGISVSYQFGQRRMDL